MIADLSVNHVERHALRCGFAVERIRNDYGYDLFLFFYDTRGHAKPGRVLLQLKATDRLQFRDAGATVACTIDRRDLRLWLDTPEPVILVLYDATGDRAFWLYVQAHFADVADRVREGPQSATVTVRLPVPNAFDAGAVKAVEKLSDDIWDQQRGKIRYHG